MLESAAVELAHDELQKVSSELEQRVQERTRDLEQALAARDREAHMKDEFLAMLGHEVRNVLAPMATALQLMRLRGPECREQEVLSRQLNHLTRLVDDLLDVSRIKRGGIELQKQAIEFSQVVIRAVEMASPLLEQRQQTLDLRVPRQGLLVHADLERLAQVLGNLLTNASKYSDPRCRIWVAVHRDQSRLRCSVKDEGIGIAPEMLQGIFDAFVQESHSLDRSRGGLGLGLAIVRNLVLQHGGSVSAQSAGVGQGSEFIVDLPLLDPQEGS